jgi:hypothetical protein
MLINQQKLAGEIIFKLFFKVIIIKKKIIPVFY